MAANRVEIGA